MNALRITPAVSHFLPGNGWLALFDRRDGDGHVTKRIAVPVVAFGYRYGSIGEETVAVFISGEYGIVDVDDDDDHVAVVPADALPASYQFHVKIFGEVDDSAPADPTSDTTD